MRSVILPRLAVAIAAMAATVLGSRRLPGQPEPHGLVGALAIGAAEWTLNGSDDAHHRVAGGVSLGYRFRLFDINNAPVSITPRVGLTATHVRGIALNSDEIAFSHLEAPSVQLAIRVRRVRPYALFGRGKTTIERYEGHQLSNYYGGMSSYGLGVELPRRNPCGAGFDVMWRHTSGEFSDLEVRPYGVPAPPGRSIAAHMVTVGWSGAFRGARLLFACH